MLCTEVEGTVTVNRDDEIREIREGERDLPRLVSGVSE